MIRYGVRAILPHPSSNPQSGLDCSLKVSCDTEVRGSKSGKPRDHERGRHSLNNGDAGDCHHAQRGHEADGRAVVEALVASNSAYPIGAQSATDAVRLYQAILAKINMPLNRPNQNSAVQMPAEVSPVNSLEVLNVTAAIATIQEPFNAMALQNLHTGEKEHLSAQAGYAISCRTASTEAGWLAAQVKARA